MLKLSINQILFLLMHWIPLAISVGPTLKSANHLGNVAILEELRTITDLILRNQQTADPVRGTQVIIHDCTTLREAGIKGSGVYVVFPFTFKVYCDMVTDGGGWTVFQRRIPTDNHEDFNRPWNDYKFGFGHLYAEFWLGLEGVHQLTNSGLFELRVDMVDYELGPRYAQYQLMTVGPEKDGYRLSVSNYSGNAGDALSTFHSGRQFSTFDSDHDVSRNKSCAQEKGGGWWFHACYAAHLNGIYPDKPKRNSSSSQIRWWSNREHVLVLTTVEMKIRRQIPTGSQRNVHLSKDDHTEEEEESQEVANNEEEEENKGDVEVERSKEGDDVGYDYRKNTAVDADEMYNITHHKGRSDVNPWEIFHFEGYE